MEKQRILVIDDDPANLTLARAVLETEGYEIEVADSGSLGLELIPQFQPHLLLLDINMPRIDGLETLQEVRKLNNYTSVIFVSARSEVGAVVDGLNAGADDYLRKPYDPRELCARVKAQLRIKELRDQLKDANKRLQELVDIDDLTGLYNMRSMYEKVEQELHRAERYGRSLAVVMLDMDGFKEVNDNHDHLFGSYVLAEIGKMIATNIRKVDFAARYGGDEFLIVLSETDQAGSKIFCERFRKQISERVFKSGEHEVQLTVSVGFAVTDKDNPVDARGLVRSADRALYVSKEKGRNCVHAYSFAEKKVLEMAGV